MYFLTLAAVAVTILIETVQQLVFKQASRVPSKKIAWTSLGVVLHAPHLAAWFFTLSLLPLSIATPLLGTSYVTVPLASQWLFKEKVTGWRWLGVLCIVAGVILVSKEMPS